MKTKKIALILMITIAIIASVFNVSYATESTSNVKSRYLTIKKLRASGYGYEALDKSIWKICESADNTGSTVNYDYTIYCMRGGPGFGSEEFGSGTPQVKEYTRYFDMKKPSTITESYASAIPSTTSDTYKSLLWLLENVYVAPKSNATTEVKQMAKEYRLLLLQNAGIIDSNATNSYITDDDIDAVQQLAIWHFTNNDAYKVENVSSEGTFEFYINAVAGTDSNYNALSDYDGRSLENLNGAERAEECQALYDYLVDTAENMAKTYEVKTASQPYEIVDTVISKKTVGNNIVIGPFKINRISSTEGTIVGIFKNGGTKIEKPIMQYQDGTSVTSLESTVDKTTGIGKEFYLVLPSNTETGKITFEIEGLYFDTKITYWSVEDTGENVLAKEQPVVEIERIKIPYSDIQEEFDLALRKFITAIGEEKLVDKNGKYTREPQVTAEALKQLAAGKVTTAIKEHTKTPVVVKTGDIVTYTIRVYNEGKIDAYVKEITDYIPEGLKLVENNTINKENGWTNPSKDGKTIVTDKLSGTILKAFDGTKLEYLDVQVVCEVVASVKSTDTTLKKIAEITAHSDKTGDVTVKDDDSEPKNLTDKQKTNYNPGSSEKGWGYEDDDDYEDLVIVGKSFDLSLRKFITAIGKEELVDEKGKYIREPVVNVSPLLNGKKTATYNHNKTPVNVEVGDIVIYTIRVYNEGEVDGYVDEITDHLPRWLQFINDEFNASYGWKVSSDGRTVTTNITSLKTEYSASRDTIYDDRTEDEDKILLKGFNETAQELDYIDVKIKCRVKDSGISEEITNIAEITKSSDATGSDLKDRDNDSLVTLPTDETLPEYKNDEINRGDKYIPGQEDDDDFEKVIVQKFDLALRKFITGVNNQTISNRVPVFSMDSEGKMIYTHSKTPVEVATGDIVVYTLRIFNEGNCAGYATEIKDDLPEGLEYLPNNDLNKEYKWKMYKKDGTETTNVEEATEIRTDYLSKELISAFNKNTMTMPNYKDVKIAFKVTEPNTSDRILTNIAEITEDRDEKGDPVEDIDSTPDNDLNGEDDIDIEKVKVKYFDLALEKIITEYSFKKDGKTTVTKTGHKFGVQPEPIVKVELLNKHSIKTAVVKFKYQIKVTNEGEVAGYATEVKDYIPEGLKFVEKDNKNWKLSEDGKTVTTDELKDKLLKPGESAVVEIVLQWINGEDNLGLKQNWAEISEDRDEDGDPVEDIDSTPDNKKEGEDDIDDGRVILSIVTGIGENYIFIIAGILVILVAGLILIRKFVL